MGLSLLPAQMPGQILMTFQDILLTCAADHRNAQVFNDFQLNDLFSIASRSNWSFPILVTYC